MTVVAVTDFFTYPDASTFHSKWTQVNTPSPSTVTYNPLFISTPPTGVVFDQWTVRRKLGLWSINTINSRAQCQIKFTHSDLNTDEGFLYSLTLKSDTTLSSYVLQLDYNMYAHHTFTVSLYANGSGVSSTFLSPVLMDDGFYLNLTRGVFGSPSQVTASISRSDALELWHENFTTPCTDAMNLNTVELNIAESTVGLLGLFPVNTTVNSFFYDCVPIPSGSVTYYTPNITGVKGSTSTSFSTPGV